jgi:outer membrane protein insertion porin family
MHTRFLAVLGLVGLIATGVGAARASAQDQPQGRPPAQAPPQQEGQAPPPQQGEQLPSIFSKKPDGQAKPPAAPAPQAPAEQPAAPAADTASRQPPAGSAPVVRAIELAFPTQQNVSVIEPQTYLYYIQARGSQPSRDLWVPYNEQTVLDDFKRLWATKFLDNLWIDVRDEPYPNGVIGKHIVYNMEEQQRVKIVDYAGSKQLEQTKIEDKLKEENVQIRLDSFIDPSVVRKVEGIVRGMLAEKGFQFAKVTHEIKPMPGGPKLVHLTFVMDEGPKVKIRHIEFDGNKEVSDGKLKGQMKGNKELGFLSFITGSGTYQEARFEEDAERVQEYYRNKGYIAARVGSPELKYLDDSSDGKTRYVQLKIPVHEGERYKVGDFGFDGNKVLKSEVLRQLFPLKAGDYYSEKQIRKGLQQAQEVYGAGGYWEFTGYPDLKPRDQPDQQTNGAETDGAQKTDGDGKTDSDGKTDGDAKPERPVRTKDGAPIVDVVMKLQEGEQYFVNRITFVGNTTTRDNVVRREMRLLEGGVFNSEALKMSLRKINQLGYFKPIEQEGPDAAKNPKVEKTPGEKNKVDVTINFEEQNRNQLTFGAGVSQYEGFFGQLAFQTSNFLGRGESVTFSVLAGRLAQNYQLAFSEPYMFDRPITAGLNLFKSELRYLYAYTQQSTGGTMTMGFPVRDFTRAFVTYSLQNVRVTDINPIYLQPDVISRNPFLQDALLVGQNGKRVISQVTPSIVHNTIDNPIFPTTGRRYTATMDFAGIGGNVNFIKPQLEGVWMFQQSRRTSFGVRAQWAYVKPFGSTTTLPIFEKLFLGGEYSIRGYDIRSIGPRDPVTGIVIGGDKSLLVNGEYLITIAGPVRLVLFYDAGQVRDTGQQFAWDQWKTSTGAEIRFFMPVLNVPFRLIFAANPQRTDVLDTNTLRPAKAFTFKFAVGSTF